MASTRQAAEVLVLGGGPAGAAVAGALAAWGVDVLVVHDARPRAWARRLESASPSLALALAPFGRGALAGLPDLAALGPAAPQRAHWPGGMPMVDGWAAGAAGVSAAGSAVGSVQGGPDPAAHEADEGDELPAGVGALALPIPGGAGPAFTLLDRDRFDAGLQAWSRAAGARWLPARGVPAADGGARVHLADAF